MWRLTGQSRAIRLAVSSWSEGRIILSTEGTSSGLPLPVCFAWGALNTEGKRYAILSVPAPPANRTTTLKQRMTTNSTSCGEVMGLPDATRIGESEVREVLITQGFSIIDNLEMTDTLVSVIFSFHTWSFTPIVTQINSAWMLHS